MNWGYSPLILLVGIAIGHYFFPREVVRETIREVQIDAPTRKMVNNPKDETTQNFVSQKDPSTKKVVNLEISSQLHDPSPRAVKNSIELSIGEGFVESLEQDLYRLRAQVSTHYESDGWKLVGNIHDTQLASVGLKDGDLIRHDSLIELKRRPHQFALVNRFEEVLKALER